MNNQIYFENFTCIEDMMTEFSLSNEELEGCEIIYAVYNTPAYEGYAHVIYVKEKKLYEVNGSHCSCNGLEDQWYPEETTLDALLFRPNVDIDAKANLKERFKNLISFL